MSQYRTLFDARGARYNLANRLFPEARAEEAQRLFAHLELRRGKRWVDVGAGGGFLADRAAAADLAGEAVGCDESGAFLLEAPGYALRTVAHFGRLPFANGTFSSSACLAVLHHAEDPRQVVGEMLRVTAKGGRAAIGDVAAGSRAAAFLNSFVDAHTETGHAGRFHAPEDLERLFQAAGGGRARSEGVEIAWRFPTRADARDFCRELFGLRPDAEDPDLDAALKELGLSPTQDGWRLPWQMAFASAARA